MVNYLSEISNLSAPNAVRALLSEYALVLDDLISVISNLSPDVLIKPVDLRTKDPDCISIQNVLTHVVQSGYTYVVEVRKWQGEEVDYRKKTYFETVDEYVTALNIMFEYNIQLFKDYPHLGIESLKAQDKIKTRWEQLYDVEQLFEHAIVHVMRHRRQINKFLTS